MHANLDRSYGVKLLSREHTFSSFRARLPRDRKLHYVSRYRVKHVRMRKIAFPASILFARMCIRVSLEM